MIKRVLIMAGGTGGHIFPALAVARLLQEKEIEIAWLGTHLGLESRVIPEAAIQFFSIPVTALRGKGFLRLLSQPWRLFCSLFQSIQIIKKFKPDVVLGMGGYVTGPGGLAAYLMRKRLIIHEQNAIMGLTNKILSRFADQVLTGFPDQGTRDEKLRVQYVGNPVRADISNIEAPEERLKTHSGSLKVLVFGGSQGAQVFNRVLPAVFARLSKNISIEVWHQSGKKYCEQIQANYINENFPARVDSFIDDMASAYSWADVMISRAGASTLAEISAVGIAAILVPFPLAVDDHQMANAKFLSEHQAAMLLSQEKFESNQLDEILFKLFSRREEIFKLSKAARNMRKVDATECVVKEICYG